MTNYYTSGSVVVGNLTQEQTAYVGRLFAVMNMIHDRGLPQPWEWEPDPDSEVARQTAREYFDGAKRKPTADDLDWQFCFRSLGTITFGVSEDGSIETIKKQQVIFNAVYRACGKVFGLQKKHFTSDRRIQLSSCNLADQVVLFLHNLRDLVYYQEVHEASLNDEALERIAWKYALDEDEYSYIVPDISEDGTEFVISATEGFNPELVSVIIQDILNALELDRVVGFEWAYTSSSAVSDGDGGGACVVGRNDMAWVDSNYFATVVGPRVINGPDCPKCGNDEFDSGSVIIKNKHNRAILRAICSSCGTALDFTYQYSSTTLVEEG